MNSQKKGFAFCRFNGLFFNSGSLKGFHNVIWRFFGPRQKTERVSCDKISYSTEWKFGKVAHIKCYPRRIPRAWYTRNHCERFFPFVPTSFALLFFLIFFSSQGDVQPWKVERSLSHHKGGCSPKSLPLSSTCIIRFTKTPGKLFFFFFFSSPYVESEKNKERGRERERMVCGWGDIEQERHSSGWHEFILFLSCLFHEKLSIPSATRDATFFLSRGCARFLLFLHSGWLSNVFFFFLHELLVLSHFFCRYTYASFALLVSVTIIHTKLYNPNKDPSE